MINFPKIAQFSNVVKLIRLRGDFQGLDEEDKPIYRHEKPYPIVKYEGTVKLHGTNAAIVKKGGVIVSVQSRTRDITVDNDNAGFARFVSELPASAIESLPDDATIFGEWCGGNIQKGVAINKLPKMFVVFSIKHEEHIYTRPESLDLSEHKIYSIIDFPSFFIEIDFNIPELSSAKMAEITEHVEKECPVAKALGVSGIGEGVIWSMDGEISGDFSFKVKGEKHSATKVKTLASVDVEKSLNAYSFVNDTVTDSRLNQGIDVLLESGKEIDMKSTGDYLRWVVTDILSEESEKLDASGLSAKDVTRKISESARIFWFARVNKI